MKTRTDLPLAGIRVVEFSHMVMGPACGLVLADLGAEVMKVEPAGKGDPTRQLTSTGAGFFAAFNRNKKSVTVDLAPRRASRRRGDSSPPRTSSSRISGPARWRRRGWATRRSPKLNPRLIYCSLKGFLDGPVRKPHGAGRGRPDDERARVHDRPRGPAASRRGARERHDGRHVRRNRDPRRASRARQRPARGSTCRADFSKTPPGSSPRT